MSLVGYLTEKYGSANTNIKKRQQIPEFQEALRDLNITNYKGTAAQNRAILDYLKSKPSNRPAYGPPTTTALIDPNRVTATMLSVSPIRVSDNNGLVATLQPEIPYNQVITVPSTPSSKRKQVKTYKHRLPTIEEVKELGGNYSWVQAAMPYLGIIEEGAGNPETQNRTWSGPNAKEFSDFVKCRLGDNGLPYCNVAQKFVYSKLSDEKKSLFKDFGDSLLGSSIGSINLLKKKGNEGIGYDDFISNPFGNALFMHPGHTGYVVGHKIMINPKTKKPEIYFITIEGNHRRYGQEGFMPYYRRADDFPKTTRFYQLPE